MKKDIFIFIVILIVVTGLAAGAATFYNKYFKPNEVFVSCYDTADTVLVIEGDVISENNPPVVRDGQILLPFDTIKNI